MNIKQLALAGSMLIAGAGLGTTAAVKANSTSGTPVEQKPYSSEISSTDSINFANAMKANHHKSFTRDYLNAMKIFVEDFNRSEKAESFQKTAEEIEYIQDTKDEIGAAAKFFTYLGDGDFYNPELSKLSKEINDNAYVTKVLKKVIENYNDNKGLEDVYEPLTKLTDYICTNNGATTRDLPPSMNPEFKEICGLAGDKLQKTYDSVDKMSADGDNMNSLSLFFKSSLSKNMSEEDEYNILIAINDKVQDASSDSFADVVLNMGEEKATPVETPVADEAKSEKPVKVYTPNGIVINRGGKTYDMSGRLIK